jgi:hypothetical protein
MSSCSAAVYFGDVRAASGLAPGGIRTLNGWTAVGLQSVYTERATVRRSAAYGGAWLRRYRGVVAPLLFMLWHSGRGWRRSRQFERLSVFCRGECRWLDVDVPG